MSTAVAQMYPMPPFKYVSVVQKNGIHHGENDVAPYHLAETTLMGEAFRLVAEVVKGLPLHQVHPLARLGSLHSLPVVVISISSIASQQAAMCRLVTSDEPIDSKTKNAFKLPRVQCSDPMSGASALDFQSLR